jgi:hypothetical protein
MQFRQSIFRMLRARTEYLGDSYPSEPKAGPPRAPAEAEMF